MKYLQLEYFNYSSRENFRCQGPKAEMHLTREDQTGCGSAGLYRENIMWDNIKLCRILITGYVRQETVRVFFVQE